MRQVQMKERRNKHKETNKTFIEAEGNVDVQVSVLLRFQKVIQNKEK